MFTVKHVFANTENYHVWGASSYFVDRDPNGELAASLEASCRDPENAVVHAQLPEQRDPEWVYPRISLTLTDGREEIFDVVGNVYITNEQGKTVDVIRPRRQFRDPAK